MQQRDYIRMYCQLYQDNYQISGRGKDPGKDPGKRPILITNNGDSGKPAGNRKNFQKNKKFSNNPITCKPL